MVWSQKDVFRKMSFSASIAENYSTIHKQWKQRRNTQMMIALGAFFISLDTKTSHIGEKLVRLILCLLVKFRNCRVRIIIALGIHIAKGLCSLPLPWQSVPV